MSDNDKMMAFGSWLVAKQLQLGNELFALSVNAKVPVDAIRVKAGHLENTGHILEAFRGLYHGDLNKFQEEYLGKVPEAEEESKEDVPQPE